MDRGGNRLAPAFRPVLKVRDKRKHHVKSMAGPLAADRGLAATLQIYPIFRYPISDIRYPISDIRKGLRSFTLFLFIADRIDVDGDVGFRIAEVFFGTLERFRGGERRVRGFVPENIPLFNYFVKSGIL